MKVGDPVKITTFALSYYGKIIKVEKNVLLKYLVQYGRNRGWFSESELKKVKKGDLNGL